MSRVTAAQAASTSCAVWKRTTPRGLPPTPTVGPTQRRRRQSPRATLPNARRRIRPSNRGRRQRRVCSCRGHARPARSAAAERHGSTRRGSPRIDTERFAHGSTKRFATDSTEYTDQDTGIQRAIATSESAVIARALCRPRPRRDRECLAQGKRWARVAPGQQTPDGLP